MYIDINRLIYINMRQNIQFETETASKSVVSGCFFLVDANRRRKRRALRGELCGQEVQLE